MKSIFDITIIVPAYNVEPFLDKCIESVLNQKTQLTYELIIIDDGSIDNTGKIADRYIAENVKVIHTVNAGSGAARNEGINCANGKWLMFLDGDDFLEQDALLHYEKVVDLDIDFCLGRRSEFWDGEESDRKPIQELIDNDDIMACKSGKDAFVLLYKRNGYVELGTKGVYRKSFLINNDLFFNTYKRGQDNEWAVRVYIAARKIGYNPYPYYCYRKGRTGSAVNSANVEKAIGVLDYQKKWTRIADEYGGIFGDILLEEASRRFVDLFCDYANNLKGLDLKKYCREVDKAKSSFVISNTFVNKLLYRCNAYCAAKYIKLKAKLIKGK